MTFLLSLMVRRTVPRRAFESMRSLTKAVSPKGAKRPQQRPLHVDFASLQIFKAVHGHLIVPILFSLNPDTPGAGSHAEGLGRHVDALRIAKKARPHYISKDDQALLDQMGFVWDVPVERFRRLVQGINLYHKYRGDFLISRSFVVPQNDPNWPEELWGMKLGEIYGTLRSKKGVPAWQARILREQGIPLVSQDEIMAQRALTALQTYKVHANIKPGTMFTVPRKFIVPHGDTRWDRTAWGMRLGAMVDRIRIEHQFPMYLDKYRNIGLCVDTGKLKATRAEKILAALEAYKVCMDIKPGQEFFVPYLFKVPSGDARWDPRMWGMKLGVLVGNVRYHQGFSNLYEKFRSMGLKMDKLRERKVRGSQHPAPEGAASHSLNQQGCGNQLARDIKGEASGKVKRQKEKDSEFSYDAECAGASEVELRSDGSDLGADEASTKPAACKAVQAQIQGKSGKGKRGTKLAVMAAPTERKAPRRKLTKVKAAEEVKQDLATGTAPKMP